jgi:signal transduction histidine kinase/CheY-like chemotaxis protein
MYLMRMANWHSRIFIALFIAIAAVSLSPSIWPVAWLGAVLLSQAIDKFVLANRVLSKPGDLPDLFRRVIIIWLGLTSLVYTGISAYLWSCGPAGQMFSIMVICGSLLHICLHRNPVRSTLITGLISQCLLLFGLPISSFILDKSHNPAPFIVMVISGVLYLGHLVAGVRQTNALNDALTSASKSKSDFLATISHEIRTPLNAVTSAAHLLKTTPLSEDQAEYVSILLGGSDVLLGLINDVLDMSKIEAGKMQVEIRDVDLREHCEKLTKIWGPKAAERGLSLTLDFDPDLPAFVRTDGLRLTQILFNLVSNAVKFTAQGSVHVRVEAVAGAGLNGPRLRFEVRDTGPGMAPEVVQRLFRSFEQADASAARKFGGTGLGLAISRRLAEMMGGGLTVESAVDSGSTLRLELTLVLSAAQSAEIAQPAEEACAPPIGARAILIAEDHPINRRLISLILDPLGWALTLAEDGAEAVSVANRMPFDVIIMDMQMPVMSGLEATHAIRNGLGPNAKTPIIALTANAFDDDRTAWLNAGAADFLTKPIDPIRLVDSILQTTARLDSEGRLGPRPAAWPEDEPLRVADRSALGGAA